jgi:hypothetical protein
MLNLIKQPAKIILLIVVALSILSCSKRQIIIITRPNFHARIIWGTEKLKETLIRNGYNISLQNNLVNARNNIMLVAGLLSDSLIKIVAGHNAISLPDSVGKEGYIIKSSENVVLIVGNDPSGVLYGCLELAERVNKKGRMPVKLDFADHPKMVLRGACVGLQKPAYLPGRKVYEYPITPENFPWFYDKNLWIKYLDMLVENRMNSLYLWNGHPFASFVRLKDYPYALEVDDVTFEKNEDIFRFLTTEANKRGIWVIQMFYNIIISKPFAEYHSLETQDRNRPIIPIVADYTRKSITAFIEKYPNVGLMVCLGEAMNTIEDDITWFTETIIPGVKEGLKNTGRTDEPPLILRGHDTDAKRVLEAALPIYRNLYTMHKYNGESLTTYEPRGQWVDYHRILSSIGTVHIANVHIMANLEPFRYGSPDFIQKSVQAMHNILGANALHLYPQASYWDWPYTADKSYPRILQINRDWIWYSAWGRYAWNDERKRQEEIDYWSARLGEFYGCGKHGTEILEAYEQAGEIAPKLLRRFGISDGNRQTLLLGMFMSQLINPYKWGVYSNFYSSNGPEGEILVDYARKEWQHQSHSGETPPQIIAEVSKHAELAKRAIEKVAPFVKINKEEFERLKNDIYCYQAIANFYAEKVKAAMLILRYKYSKDITDLEKALPFLEKSVLAYTELTKLTDNTYLYANSMQTQQRRIPVSGKDGMNKTWAELLPQYREELENFKRNITNLKTANKESNNIAEEPLLPVDVQVTSPKAAWYPVSKNQRLFSDKDYKIKDFAPELKYLKGLRLSYEMQVNKGTVIEFKCNQPVKLVAGYFNGNSYKILPPPSLETNAHANDRGQADIKIANVLDIEGLYPVNIYTYDFDVGEHKIEFAKGIVIILGFIDGKQQLITHDAGIGTEENSESIDWLFY